MRNSTPFLRDHPEIETVDAIYPDLCNLWRGKRLERADTGKLYDSGLPVAGAMFLIDVTGETCDPGGRGFTDGDPDHLARPGADANPYLALAAVLAGMDHGITNRIDPGPPQQGAVRPDGNGVPHNWRDALDAMAQSSLLGEYFGQSYIGLYVATKRGEMDRFMSVPSALEYNWYLGAG